MPSQILLVDADAYFVAVARVAYPEIRDYPYILVGGPPSQRSVVSSASYETRAFGVTSGMSMDMALGVCPKAIQRPVPWKECRIISASIEEVIATMAPVVEAASIDEWYADLTQAALIYKGQPLGSIATELRAKIKIATGITVSVGCGANKLIAKVAAEHAKPRVSSRGVYEVLPGSEADFMSPQLVSVIPGVGPKLTETLARFGLKTCQDVLATEPETIAIWFGSRIASWLPDACRGVSSAPLSSSPAAKSISRDTTFPADLSGLEALWPHLIGLIDLAASDLRAQGLAARTIAVKIRTRSRTDFSKQSTSAPQSTDPQLRTTARELLEALVRAHPGPIRLLSFAVRNLVPTPPRRAP